MDLERLIMILELAYDLGSPYSQVTVILNKEEYWIEDVEQTEEGVFIHILKKG